MTLKREVIDALVAAGCTAEQVAAAIKADMMEEEARKENKRAKDRERQRKRRARHAESHPVTRDNAESHPVTRKKEEVSPQTPLPEEKTYPPSPPKGGSSPRAVRLPENWTLSDDWRDWAIKEGWPADRVALEASKFGDYWHAAGGQRARKRDWMATWRNWMRNVPKASENGKIERGNDRDRKASAHDKLFTGFAQAARDG